MPADRAADPIQALEWCTAKLNPKSPETFSLCEAPAGFLAADVTLSFHDPDATSARATINGYVISADPAPDGVYPFLGSIGADGRMYGPDGSPVAPVPPGSASSASSKRGVWRVETGAPLPTGADRVVPVREGLLLGGERVRLERSVSGAGVERGRRPSLLAKAGVVPAGSRLDERLRSLLLAHHVEHVSVRPPCLVGCGTIGDELIDLTVGGPVEPGQTRDVIGYWLGDAVAGCGQRPVPLGILPDQPTRLREVIHGCRGRKIEVAVLAGGVGRGFTDRVIEALRRMDARILFTEVTLNGSLGCALAKTQGLDVLVLSGRPLWCAALFDLFVRPALLSRAGAARFVWDWSCQKQLPRSEGLELSETEGRGAWGLFPALGPEAERGALLVPPAADVPFDLPSLPAQRGWIVARAGDRVWEPRFFVSVSQGPWIAT